jgi:hypothetical protein
VIESKQAVLFLKKKNQKNFCVLRAWAPPEPNPTVNESFFASFLSLKEALTFLASRI